MTQQERTDFERAFGRLEGKVDMILSALPTFMTKVQCDAYHQGGSKIEDRNWKRIAVSVSIGAVIVSITAIVLGLTLGGA